MIASLPARAQLRGSEGSDCLLFSHPPVVRQKLVNVDEDPRLVYQYIINRIAQKSSNLGKVHIYLHTSLALTA
jgi:hypothetical protein